VSYFNLCEEGEKDCDSNRRFREQSFNFMKLCFIETAEILASFFGFEKYDYKRISSSKEDFMTDFIINPLSSLNDRFWLKSEEVQT